MILRRVKFDKYDELIESIDFKNFFSDHDKVIKQIEDCSEDILYNGRCIEMEIDENEYLPFLENCKTLTEPSFEISKKLFADLKYKRNPLPISIMYQKEVWTYLNNIVFFNLIKKRYFVLNDEEETIDETAKGKIERLYFNIGGFSKMSRTGLRYLWSLSNSLHIENDYDLVLIALNFIDPFKAIQECIIGTNFDVLKAFALAIKKLNYDPRIKNHTYRKVVPKHIRNYACFNYFENSSLEEQSTILASEIYKIINFENDTF